MATIKRIILSICLTLLGIFPVQAQVTPPGQQDSTASGQQDSTARVVTDSLTALASQVQITQGYVDVPGMSLYLKILDDNGLFVSGVQKNQIRVSAGDQAVPVDSILTFTESGEGTAYIFLIDVSKSLYAAQIGLVQKMIGDWVEASTPEDRFAMVTFGEDVNVLVDYTADKQVIRDSVDALHLYANKTRLHDGIIRAVELASRRDKDLPDRRAIVMLSDGIDDFSMGATREEVLENLRVDPTPIYAVGLTDEPIDARKENGLKSLGEFARTSGGTLMRTEQALLDTTSNQLYRTIQDTYVLRLQCAACPSDGDVYVVNAEVQSGNRRVADNISLRFRSSTEPDTLAVSIAEVPASGIPGMYYYLGAGLFLLLCTGLIVWMRRKGEVDEAPEQAHEPDLEEIEAPAEPSPAPVPLSTVDHGQPEEPKGIPVRLISISYKNDPVVDKTITLRDRFVLGRDSRYADLPVPHDDQISAAHCALSYENDMVLIEDLRSTNGTQINGVPIQGRYRLQQHDLIQIGSTKFKILINDLDGAL